MSNPYKSIKNITVTACDKHANNNTHAREENGLLNPYKLDSYHMGEAFSPSIEMMYGSHASDGPKKRADIKERDYVYLVCKVTGNRWKISIEKEE